jgi:hypothetical protein
MVQEQPRRHREHPGQQSDHGSCQDDHYNHLLRAHPTAFRIAISGRLSRVPRTTWCSTPAPATAIGSGEDWHGTSVGSNPRIIYRMVRCRHARAGARQLILPGRTRSWIGADSLLIPFTRPSSVHPSSSNGEYHFTAQLISAYTEMARWKVPG